MSIVISDELQELFDLRDHASVLREKVSLAEAKCHSNMQQNSGKEFVDVHDLDVTHKLLKTTTDCREEFEANEQKFQEKKRFFINLIRSSGSTKLTCTNKEWDDRGNFHYVPYILSIDENSGSNDLLIEPAREYNMAE
jgi:hypothetical protein